MGSRPLPPPALVTAMSTPTEGEERRAIAERIIDWYIRAGYGEREILVAVDPYRSICNPSMTAVELAAIIRDVAGTRLVARGIARRAGVIAPPDMGRLPSGLGWRYAWPAAGIALALDRVIDRRGRMEAELTVYTEGDDLPPVLHGPVRVDMLSTRDRMVQVQYLQKRLDLAAWPDILETAFRLAVEGYRAGEPLERLMDPLPDDAADYAIDPLLVAGDPTLIFGEPGKGKSWLALMAALALDIGPGAPYPFRVVQQHRVLYLDYEWRRRPHHWRATMLGATPEGCGIYYHRSDRSLISGIDGLRRHVRDEGITYLVIDSIAAALGGDPMDASLVIPFGNAVRSLGVGSLWIGHPPKNGDAKTVFGSQFWTAQIRSGWQVERAADLPPNVIKMALHHRKANDIPEAAQPLAFRLDFEAGKATCRAVDFEHAPEFQDSRPPRARVLTVLAQGSASAADIASATGVPLAEVKKALGALVRAGQAIELATGSYGLATVSRSAGKANGHAIKSGAAIAAELPL